ncbi:MFS transporter [Microbacterium saperdae]|uniref:MFS transporter n=1 Tax=Microbacterium saperdae TaxID=69368 RepID=UPI00147754EF|nr:MFS transporter [Microbacterium saperdae]
MLDPDNRVVSLAIITGIGGFIGIATNPLVGWLSDMTSTRWGRRRPWLLGGVLVIAPAAILAGHAGSVAELTLWWTVLQVGANMLMAPLTATIPDMVPAHRSGTASACLGISWACAPVVGTLAQTLAGSPDRAYSLLAGLIVLSQIFFIFTVRQDTARPDQKQVRSTAWRELLPNDRDLALAWVHRFLFALGQNIAITYLFFYLQDVVRFEELYPDSSTDEGVLILTALYGPAVIVAALLTGSLADRTQRFKIYIIGATAAFACGTLLGALTASWTGVLVLAALTGIGFGAYEAVSMAMTIRLLPDEQRRARDLSIINVATMIAIAIGPVAAALLISLSGYAAMFLIAGVLVLISGAVAWLIRGVR